MIRKFAAPDPRKIWQVLQRASKIRSHLGADSADRHTIEHLGAVYRAARNRFFKDPQVLELGITPRTKNQTISELLKKTNIVQGPINPPSAPGSPTPPQAPLVQGTFDFFKDAGQNSLSSMLRRLRKDFDV